MDSEPKRQHQVPRAYLARRALGGSVAVRRRAGKQFKRNPKKVAVEGGFYDVLDDSGVKSTVVEKHLADIERPAIAAMTRIDQTGRPPDVGTDDRNALAYFLALQATRTSDQRARWQFPEKFLTFAAGKQFDRELVRGFLRDYLRSDPSETELTGATNFLSVATGSGNGLTQDQAISVMLAGMDELLPILVARHWTIENDRKGRFITSDSPSERDEYDRVGFGNAEEIRFPLDPTRQLVLSAQKRTPTMRANTERVRACNADLAARCHESSSELLTRTSDDKHSLTFDRCCDSIPDRSTNTTTLESPSARERSYNSE